MLLLQLVDSLKLGFYPIKIINTLLLLLAVAVVVLAALITPSGDPFSLLICTVHLYLLYEFSILICRKDESAEQIEEAVI